MSQNFDPKAVIMALGPPPRQFAPEATKRLPRAGAIGVMIVALCFGAFILAAAASMAGGAMSDRGQAVSPALVGALMMAFASWQIMKKRRIRALCEDLLKNGRATTGYVKSLASQQVQGVVTDRYEIEYQDASPKRHTLRAFWVHPEARFTEHSMIVVLHDPAAPERAAVFPLDFPDLRVQVPDLAGTHDGPPSAGPGLHDDPDLKMIEALAAAGAPLNFGQSSPEKALSGGVIKAGLYPRKPFSRAGRLRGGIGTRPCAE